MQAIFGRRDAVKAAKGCRKMTVALIADAVPNLLNGSFGALQQLACLCHAEANQVFVRCISRAGTHDSDDLIF